jgi:hypothetical protein
VSDGGDGGRSERDGEREGESKRERERGVGKCQPKEERERVACVWVGEWKK